MSDFGMKRPIEKLRSGQSIFVEGEEGTDVFLVVRGAVRFSAVLKDGRRLVSGFAVEGDHFSLSHNGRHIYSAEAACDLEVRRLVRSQIEERAAAGEEPWRRIVAGLESEPWVLQTEMLRLLHRNADESIASFVLELARRLNPTVSTNSRVRLDMSRADIADYLGLTVETVVRSLKRLTRNGPLTANGPHELRITDLETLQKRASGVHSADTESLSRSDSFQARQPFRA